MDTCLEFGCAVALVIVVGSALLVAGWTWGTR